MSIVRRIKEALVSLSAEKPPKKVFSVPVSKKKRIVGIEEEFVLRLPTARIDSATEIALPKQIPPPEK